VRAVSVCRSVTLLLLAVSVGLACRSPAPGFDNVILITLDTLRADHLGCYGYPRATSPFLDFLAARGVRFEHAITASSHTAPSHASIFTSHYPARHRVLHNGVRLKAQVPTLASALSEGGFETAAVTSVAFLKSVSRGFATVLTPNRGGYRPADKTIDAAIDWLRTRTGNERFALWVHLYDAHNSKPTAGGGKGFREHLRAMRSDATSRVEELSEFLAEEHGVSEEVLSTDLDRFNRYDAQVRFIDGELARLFDEVGRATADASTLWVITADHGEGLGSHNYIGHGMNLYREQLWVPLLFYGGDVLPQGLVVSTLVRSVDLFPTIMDLVGVPASSAQLEWEGQSLRGSLFGGEPSGAEIAFAQRRPVDAMRLNKGWIDELVLVAQTSDAKYIRRSVGADEFYDLESDPLETINLFGQGGDAEHRLAQWLAAKYGAMAGSPLAGTTRSVEVDEVFVDELRALGYVD
jgi:arylsulfatase A-like enzyme